MQRLLIIAIALLITVNTYAQNSKTVTDELLSKQISVKFENTLLKEVCNSLSQRYKIRFKYEVDITKMNVRHFLAHRISLEDGLQRLLMQFKLTFIPETNGVVRITRALPKSIITGQVKDSESGKPIPFANVFLKGTEYGSSTDADGNYKISAIEHGIYRLVTRVIGYDTTSLRYNLESGKEIRQNFLLNPIALQMEEIVKTAKAEKRIYKPQMSTFSLDIRKSTLIPSYGEKDIYRALQLMPGVVVTSDFKSQLYVRGGNSDQNLVLIDGGVAYNPFHFSGILSAFDVDALDNLVFYTGGFSAEYGGRLSSVLDIRTRKGNDKYSGMMNVGPLSAKLLLEGPMWGKNRFLISGRRSFINRIGEIMGDRVVPDFYDGILRLDYQKSKNEQIILSSFYGKDKVKMKEGGGEEDLTSQNLVSGLCYNRTFGEKTFGILSTHLGWFDTIIPPPATVEEPQKNTLYDWSFEFKMEYLAHQNFNLKWGIRYNQIDISFKSFDPIITEMIIDQVMYEGAAFIQGQYTYNEKWIFDGGLRFNYYHSNSPISFEPRLSVQYKLYNFLTLKGAVGRFSQNLVTIYNENDTYNPIDIWLPPEFAMKPAKADHFIIGVTYDTPSLIISVEGYWKRYHNLTQYNRERLEEADPFFVQGKGNAIGLDLSLQLISDKWQVWSNYSLGRARKELPFKYPEPGVEEFYPRYDRRHNFNFVAEYQPFKNFVLSMRFTLASGLPFSFMIGAYERFSGWVIDKNMDYPSHHPQEPIYYYTAIRTDRDAYRFPWYHRLDLSINYLIKWRRFTFKPYSQIINLYNQPNVLYYDAHGQPYASVPFLPVAGIEIQF